MSSAPTTPPLAPLHLISTINGRMFFWTGTLFTLNKQDAKTYEGLDAAESERAAAEQWSIENKAIGIIEIVKRGE
jgi:hypothetical protein